MSDKTSLLNDLYLLVHVDGTLPEPVLAYCEGLEGKYPYFKQGFINADLGRHVHQTDAIRAATDGFALADKHGRVLQRYSTYEAAVDARNGAIVKLAPEVKVEAPLTLNVDSDGAITQVSGGPLEQPIQTAAAPA